MVQAVVFDVDGTLVDSVDLHALAWQRAFVRFGHAVAFDQARSQIGKGGDKLIPVFLSQAEQRDHGEALEQFRADLFREEYLGMVKPFAAVRALVQRAHETGLKVAVASSAKKPELDVYLQRADIADLIDATVCSDDVEQSKPDPDVFQAALQRLGVETAEAVAVGDSPYDAIAAGRADMRCIGVLSGGFSERDLRDAGCAAVYPGVATLWSLWAGSANPFLPR